MTTTHEGQSVADNAARVLTSVLAPAHLAIGLLLLVGAASHPAVWHGLGWGALAALIVGAAPYAWILHAVRRGRLTSRHIPERGKRLVPLALAAGLAAGGLVLLAYFGAPRQLIALVLAMLAGLAVTAAITAGWKISIHAAVSGGTTAVLTTVFGPAFLALGVLAIAVCWSRVHMQDHTVAQVIVGGVVGAVSAMAVFVPLL